MNKIIIIKHNNLIECFFKKEKEKRPGTNIKVRGLISKNLKVQELMIFLNNKIMNKIIIKKFEFVLSFSVPHGVK